LQAFQPTLDKYKPTWWTNAHMQVVLTFLVPQSSVLYKRDVVVLKDGGHASLDWAMEAGASLNASSLQPDAPIALIMHGLTGCSDSMRSLCAEALASGYRPVVFNKRGHGGLKLATPKLQEFGCVQDLMQAITQIETAFPLGELYGIGYSAGSGLLCSYFGETGNESKLRAGVLVSPGYNARDLFCGGRIHPLYNFLMTQTLKQFLLKHQSELKHVVHVPSALKAKSIREFDEHVYMKMHGYDDLDTYWQFNNPMRAVENIQRPLLCINALDDPVCTKETIPYEQFTSNPISMLVETAEGSHCAFYEGHLRLKSWAHEAALTYLDSVRSFQAKQTEAMPPSA
jgi:predicted alpha/beta-fold hydrolase